MMIKDMIAITIEHWNNDADDNNDDNNNNNNNFIIVKNFNERTR